MKCQNVNMLRITSICLAILFIGLMSASVTHAETYDFIKYVGDQNSAKACSSGSDIGQLNYPAGVAVDSSGNVYVADQYNNRIQKFSSTGGYLTQWGSYGSGDGQFNYPEGVAVDSSGNVYVSDTYNHRIQMFSSTGGYLTQWGSYGSGDGQFYNPWSVAVDSSGNVYVADEYNHRIQKFSSLADTLHNGALTVAATDNLIIHRVLL
jgi:DNA-binding beta-propeller fold protein YncE